MISQKANIFACLGPDGKPLTVDGETLKTTYSNDVSCQDAVKYDDPLYLILPAGIILITIATVVATVIRAKRTKK